MNPISVTSLAKSVAATAVAAGCISFARGSATHPCHAVALGALAALSSKAFERVVLNEKIGVWINKEVVSNECSEQKKSCSNVVNNNLLSGYFMDHSFRIQLGYGFWSMSSEQILNPLLVLTGYLGTACLISRFVTETYNHFGTALFGMGNPVSVGDVMIDAVVGPVVALYSIGEMIKNKENAKIVSS